MTFKRSGKYFLIGNVLAMEGADKALHVFPGVSIFVDGLEAEAL
jgi:hypothetical protein